MDNCTNQYRKYLLSISISYIITVSTESLQKQHTETCLRVSLLVTEHEKVIALSEEGKK